MKNQKFGTPYLISKPETKFSKKRCNCFNIFIGKNQQILDKIILHTLISEMIDMSFPQRYLYDKFKLTEFAIPIRHEN